jgi:hypothetical protein
MTNIAKAIDRLREERRDAQNQVQGTGTTAHAGTQHRAKRVLSAAGRRRISLAQKARWAKIRQIKKAA